MRRPRRPLLAALASAPRVHHTSPARRLPPASTPDADRSPSASHEDSPRSLRRMPVAPYRPEFRLLRAIPLRRCPATSAPTPGDRFAHAVFSASRLPRVAFQLCAVQTPPARVIRGRSFGLTYQNRARLFSQPGRDRQSPGDVHGICLLPFAVLLSSAGDDACSDVSHPHAVSPLATARVIVAGSGWTEGLWPRLLGFGPTNEPYRVICRPRYSFYA